MSGVQLTLFDIIVIVVVGLSALAAMMRGVVREILGLASWIGAAIVAFLALPYVGPLVRPVVAGDALADGVAAVGVFVVALVALQDPERHGGARRSRAAPSARSTSSLGLALRRRPGCLRGLRRLSGWRAT